MQRSATLDALQHHLVEAYNHGRLGPDVLSRRDGVEVIGSDPQERWVGYQAIAAGLAAGAGRAPAVERIEIEELRSFEEGDVGWSSAALRVALAGGGELPLRATAVFRREGERWCLVQLHGSLGVPAERSLEVAGSAAPRPVVPG
jgi:SnoaL-like domain